MNEYTLTEVTTENLSKEFIDFPKELYKSYPNWVCPLDSDIESRFDAEKNELFEGGEAVRWIIYDKQNKVVGRIAAFYNTELAKAGAQSEDYPMAGGCGFFECINDQYVANMLFDSAVNWLKDRGMEAMDGPINFGDRDQWWGLLVQGFEHQPLYANNYNPCYYVKLFENYGFQNYFNQHTYHRELEAGKLSDSVYQRIERLEANPDLEFRSIKLKEIDKVADDFRTVYNQGWAKFSGVKPIDKAHSDALINNMKAIIDPKLIFFAYHKGEAIGFFISIPDLNRVIGDFNGKLTKLNLLKLAYRLKISRKADRVFGLIFGVIPDFHGKGIESGLMYQLERQMRQGKIKYKSLELAWVGDFNPVMMRMVENYVCAKRHKMHTTYRYMFNPEQKFLRSARMGAKKKQ